MPRWIVEDPSTTYFLLGLVALALGVAFWLKQERKYLVGLGIVAGLIALVALLDYLIVTDYERTVMIVKEMAAAVGKRDAATVASHVIDDFHYNNGPGGKGNRERFRKLVDVYIRDGSVSELKVWDFERGPGIFSREAKKGQINFMAKPHGNLTRGEHFRCVADFVLEADGKWRMTSFRLLTPEKDPKSQDTVPVPAW